MKKFFNKVADKVRDVSIDVSTEAQALANDVAGSDTTEKIGMVVVAVLIVGLLAVAMNKAMPGLFDNIITTAQEKLNTAFAPG